MLVVGVSAGGHTVARGGTRCMRNLSARLGPKAVVRGLMLAISICDRRCAPADSIVWRGRIGSAGRRGCSWIGWRDRVYRSHWRTPESRSCGAIRSERAAADLEQRSQAMSVTICHFLISEPSESLLRIAAFRSKCLSGSVAHTNISGMGGRPFHSNCRVGEARQPLVAFRA